VKLLAGASISFASSQHLAALSVGDEGTATIAAAGDRVLTADALALSDAGAKIDLVDNRMILRNQSVGTFAGGAYSGVSGLVARGRGDAADPAWDGDGIVTSDTRALSTTDLVSVGVARVGDLLGIAGDETASLWDQQVLASDVATAVTWGGDANLDRIIDADDYFRIYSNLSRSGATSGWFNGDFNYDGAIDGDDLFIIDSNFLRQDGTFAPAGSPESIGSVAAVPEPSALAVIALAACALSRSRRVKSSSPLA
jgi:hypothetical protein